ncbi:phage baseplate assembly protein V [Utexia brackfieldae]|uniref:phage baseplate assembly protein V n=1 Tax=Utexia brackfieldae TaxID=3074108 RepID=UPI00370D513E
MKSYHPADLIDILRKLDNLIRQGIIEESSGDRVKVRTGENLTTWLPWLTYRAGKNRTWWRPSIGEQVLLLSPGGELQLAIVLPSIYSNAFPAPSNSDDGLFIEFADKATFEYDNKMTFKLPDGAIFSYDPNSSTLNISGINTAFINAKTSITAKAGAKISLNAPLVECSNHITFQSFGATGGGGESTTGVITGNVEHKGGNLSTNGIVLNKHTHSDVQTGSDSTGGPQ